MKINYSRSCYVLLLLLIGAPCWNAQESDSLLKLRQKLKDSKDDRSSYNVRIDMLNQFSRENKVDSVIAYGIQISEYCKTIKNYPMVGNLYMTIYTNYLSKGDRTKAEYYRVEAQRYLQLSENVDAKAMLLVTNAQNLSIQNKWEEASVILNDIFQLQKSSSNKLSPTLMTNVFLMSIANFQQQNKFAEAYKRSLEFLDYTNKNNKENTYISTYMMGLVQYRLKNYQKALALMDNSEAMMPVNNQAFLAEVNIIRSFSYLELKNYSKAKQFASSSLEFAEQQKMSDKFPRLYYLFANIYQKEKNYDKAIEYAQKGYDNSPQKDMYQIRSNAKILVPVIKVDQIQDQAISFPSEAAKKIALQNLRKEIESDYQFILSEEIVHNADVDALVFEYYSKIDEMLGDYQSAFSYYKKHKELENRIANVDNIRGVEEAQAERSLAEQRLKIKFEEEAKQLRLQKELELKSLKFEFEQKQANTKTKEERARLLLEEEHKRREIGIKYDEEQKAIAIRYEQEKKLERAQQEKKDAVAKAEIESSNNIRNMSLIGVLLASALLGFAVWSYNQKRKDRNKIAAEKKKSEDLLLNILPQEVAQELKEKGKSDAKYYDEVSVLFTDFVNFTATSEKIGVKELLEELNVCFTEFDNIMEKHGLEKIKTIGDAYLAVSGLPAENKEHAQNAIKASQDILCFIEKRKKINPHALDIRIGIHSGHVIAGIVGVKKFAYDIWGDTVNTAARMEQNSEKGKINISKNTYELVKNDFTTTYRGEIEVKGKGAMDMYFVKS